MTESEAWLEIGKQVDGMGPFPVVGLCNAIDKLEHVRGGISTDMASKMRFHLGRFSPFDSAIWYWEENTNRDQRTLRATACDFLAAMADGD